MTQPINILGTNTVLGSTAKMGVRRSIEGVTRLIGRDEKFKVQLDVTFDNTVTASTAYRRNKSSIRGTVSLPCVADDQHIPEWLYQQLLGYTCHEILHPLLTGWDQYQDYGQTYGHDVVNMLEDVCIEVINHRLRWQPGGEKFLGICKAHMVQKSYDSGWTPETLVNHSDVAWVVKVLGIAKLCKYPEVQQYIGVTETRLLPSGYANKVDDIISALSQLCNKYLSNPIGGYEERMEGLELILKQFFSKKFEPTDQPPVNPKRRPIGPQPPKPTDNGDEDEDEDEDEDDTDGEEEEDDDTEGGEGDGEGEDGEGEEDDDDGGDTGGGDSEDDDDDPDIHGDPNDTNGGEGGEGGDSSDDPEAGDGNSKGKKPFSPPTEHDEMLEKAREEFEKLNKKLEAEGLNPKLWRNVQLPVRILTLDD